MMRFYNQQHRFYCGVDLHARTLSLHVLDAEGKTVLAKTSAAEGTSRMTEVYTHRPAPLLPPVFCMRSSTGTSTWTGLPSGAMGPAALAEAVRVSSRARLSRRFIVSPRVSTPAARGRAAGPSGPAASPPRQSTSPG